jgi:PAS domain S-box-containing protein
MSTSPRPVTLADTIAAHRDEIVREWTLEATRTLGERLEGHQLTDGLPALLSALVASLRSRGGAPAVAEAAAEHGAQRLQAGVDLARVLREYAILRRILLETADRHGVSPSVREILALDELLDVSTAEAGVQYVAERDAAEEAAEARLRDLADHAPAAVFVKDDEGRYVFANRWAAELVGLRPAELVGRTARDLFPPEVAERTAGYERIARSSGELVTEDAVSTPDGERVLAAVRFAYRLRSGKIGTVGIGFDVSDRRRAQAEAQHAAELLELGDAFLEIDREWRIVRVNARQEQLSRRPRAETVGRVVWEIWPEIADPRSRYWIEYHRAMDRRVPVQFEEYFAPLELWTGVTAYPVSGGGIAVFFRDISSQKRAETELREALARLEYARTFEQHLLGIVSHDLRTPLATILNGAHVLLARGGLGEPDTRTVERIASAGQRAARMISDLLDFAAARLGQRIPVNPRPADAARLAEAAADEVRGAFPGHAILVEREGDVSGSWDPDRLTQLLANLLANACKYGAAGSPVVVHVRGGGDEVAIAVHNAGEPVPEDVRPSLFEPLAAGTSASRGGGGRSVGLGLYIVREIARSHGGRVSVESSREGGTTFTVSLPRYPARSPDPRQGEAEAAPP